MGASSAGREQLRHCEREVCRSAGWGEVDPAGEVAAGGEVPAPKQDGGGAGTSGKDGRGMLSRHRSVYAVRGVRISE